MTEVTLITAFTAGLLTFFAPCTFVALPIFLTYLASQVVESGSSSIGINRMRVFRGALIYVLGFLTVFVLLGVSAVALTQVFRVNRDLFSTIGGGIILLSGLFMLFGHKISRFQFLFRERKLQYLPKHTNYISRYIVPFIIGATTAFAWTPCVGPVLGAIIFMAGVSTETPLQGGFLLFVHGLGITLPFLLIALFMDRATPLISKISKYTPILYQITAILIVLIGLAMLTGFADSISTWIYSLYYKLGFSPIM